MSLHAGMEAHRNGYDENMFLDPAQRKYVEETGGANFLFVAKDGSLVTPKSDSILPSITRRSLLYVAEHYLGIQVTERPVELAELGEFAECGVCGTAAGGIPRGQGGGPRGERSSSPAEWRRWDRCCRNSTTP